MRERKMFFPPALRLAAVAIALSAAALALPLPVFAVLDRARALEQLGDVPCRVLFSTQCFRQRGALIADRPDGRKGRAA